MNSWTIRNWTIRQSKSWRRSTGTAKRLRLTAALTFVVATLGACGGKASQNPTAPSPPSGSASVSAVVVTSAPTSDTTFKLGATARMTDGSSLDVTTLARWESSNPSLAVVSSAGVLTAVGSGQVEVRATYQNVVGSLTLLVSVTPRPTKFALSGTAIETAPTSIILPGVRVQVTTGPDAGATVTTDSGGLFRFAALTAATITLEASKEGYLLWRITNLQMDRDRQLEIVLFPTPPNNASGAPATARCKDGTWSWAQTRADACTDHGGIVYTVCPGSLCELPSRAAVSRD